MTALYPPLERAEPLEDQIRRLAEVIGDEVPGEPSRSEGAVDCAIRIIRGYVAFTSHFQRNYWGDCVCGWYVPRDIPPEFGNQAHTVHVREMAEAVLRG